MKGFFSIEIKTPASPPPGDATPQEKWESFSPGMRREIWRQHEKDQKP